MGFLEVRTMVDFRILTTFFVAITSVTSERIPNINTEVLIGDDAKEFTSLLQNLIKVNEGRMKSIKAIVHDKELPAYPQKFGRVLRTALGANDDMSRENRNGPDIEAYFVLPGQRISSQMDVLFKLNEEDFDPPTPSQYINTSSKNDSYILRSSCNTRAIRKCYKLGCKKAIYMACSIYHCKAKFVKFLKKQCKKNCKFQFGSNRW